VRNNLYDWWRASLLTNLETIHRNVAATAAGKRRRCTGLAVLWNAA
jgi:hypothetical protein